MSKQQYFKMSNEVALELIKEWCRPDMPTLGHWFGWNQPKKDGSIKLGSIYGKPNNNYSLRELLEKSEIGYNAAKDTIKMLPDNASIDEPLELSGIYSIEEVFIDFNALEPYERALTRLKVMLVNTMTEGHNWSIAYGEYLAQQYWDYESNDGWLLYESGYKTNDDILGEILEWGHNPDISWHVWDNDECYHYFNEFEKLPTYEKLKEIQDYDHDLINDILGESVSGCYWDEILSVLAWCIEWIIESWDNGDLTLSYDESLPDKLKSFISSYDKQSLLDGFETI